MIALKKNFGLHFYMATSKYCSSELVFAKFLMCCNFSIVDVSSSVFVQPLLLIDFVQKTLKIDIVDRNLTEPEYDKVSTLSPALIQNAMCKITSDV